jgi:uncharacterized protein (TIGR02147 family)
MEASRFGKATEHSTSQPTPARLAAEALASAKALMNEMPHIVSQPLSVDYMDYRKLLEDFYSYKREMTKKDLRPYSYAMFSAAANIKSPNYLRMIIEGKRNLSPDMIAKFGKAMSMAKDEAQDFRMLVLYNQSSDPAQRNMLLKDLSDHRVNLKIKSGEIDRKTWEKIPSWITWILYSMIDQEGVSFSIDSLRDLLRKKASTDEIQAALRSLIETGEVEQNETTGMLQKTRSLIDSPEEIPVALVRKLQSQLMYLGMESLFQDSPTEREFGTATLSLTAGEFEELRFKLRQMRKATQKENSVKRMTSKGERVYQLNLQLFPVTNRAK